MRTKCHEGGTGSMRDACTCSGLLQDRDAEVWGFTAFIVRSKPGLCLGGHITLSVKVSCCKSNSEKRTGKQSWPYILGILLRTYRKAWGPWRVASPNSNYQWVKIDGWWEKNRLSLCWKKSRRDIQVKKEINEQKLHELCFTFTL